MVICPIALAVHCTGCPLVKFCPFKTILGDYGKEPQAKKDDDNKANGTDHDCEKH